MKVLICQLLAVIVFFPVGSVQAGPYDGYSKAMVCQEKCHDLIYREWKTSTHAKAYTDPFYQRITQLASKETKGKTDLECIRCHSPIAFLRKEVPPVDGSKMSEIAREGVTCDFCHTVRGFQGHEPGNGLYVGQPGNIKYGTYADAQTKNHACEKSDLQGHSKFCGICHQWELPSGVVMIDTYQEWIESKEDAEDRVADGGEEEHIPECPECHMSLGTEKFVPRMGQSAQLAPIRPHVGVHTFSGANLLLAQLMGESANLDKIQRRLAKAATLEVVDIDRSASGKLSFAVKVTNVGAAHKLPTGMLDSRHIWLTLTLTDANGKVVYKSGHLDSQGILPKDAHIFRAVVADAAGKQTFKVWEVQQLLSDNRLSFAEPRLEQFSVSGVPAGVPLTLKVVLNYRPTYQEQVGLVFKGAERVTVPVIKMIEISQKIL